MTYTGDVNLDYLVKLVSAMFLHFMVAIFPIPYFCLWKSHYVQYTLEKRTIKLHHHLGCALSLSAVGKVSSHVM